MKVFVEDACIDFRESSLEEDKAMHKGRGYRDPSMGPFLWVNISDGVVGCRAHLNAFEAGLVIDVLNAWLRKHDSAEVRPLDVEDIAPPGLQKDITGCDV